LFGKPAREIECESEATKFNNNKPVIYLLPLPLETRTANARSPSGTCRFPPPLAGTVRRRLSPGLLNWGCKSPRRAGRHDAAVPCDAGYPSQARPWGSPKRHRSQHLLRSSAAALCLLLLRGWPVSGQKSAFQATSRHPSVRSNGRSLTRGAMGPAHAGGDTSSQREEAARRRWRRDHGYA